MTEETTSKEPAYCPNCNAEAKKTGKKIECPTCDAIFTFTKQGPRVKEIGPIKALADRVTALEAGAGTEVGAGVVPAEETAEEMAEETAEETADADEVI